MANTSTPDSSETQLRKFYEDKILSAGITGKGKSTEIIDIISDYPWSAHTLSSVQGDGNSISFNHNIPFCYAIERRQTVASNVTSMLNLLLGGVNATGTAASRGAKEMSNAINSLAQKAEPQTNSTTTQATGQPPAQPKTPAAASSGSGGSSGNGTGGTGSGTASGGTPTTTKETVSKETPENKVENQQTPSQMQSAAASLSTFLSKTANFMTVLQNWINQGITSVAGAQLSEGNLQSSQFLQPWKWLYFTKLTNKRYVFPTFKGTELLSTQTQWGNGSGKENPLNFILEGVQKGAEVTYGLWQLSSMLPTATDRSATYELFNLETAKGFNYSADQCAELECSFPLFNTTRKDAWKKNYRFIMMFILRNLPLRTSLFAYMPPLLYDVLIPGVKQLPLCYVSNVGVAAQGHIRMMKADNILKELAENAKSDTTLVPVPEAWSITIKFKSLIPETMNLILSTVDFPINVSKASNTTNNASNNNKNTK